MAPYDGEDCARIHSLSALSDDEVPIKIIMPARRAALLIPHFLISSSVSIRTFAAGPEEAGFCPVISCPSITV